MGSLALERTDVIVGVDTPKDTHAAVAIDGLGGRLGELSIATTNVGYAELLAWANTWGRLHLRTRRRCPVGDGSVSTFPLPSFPDLAVRAPPWPSVNQTALVAT